MNQIVSHELRGQHPRPQLIRPERWWSLDGTWQFVFDDLDEGLRQRWYLDHSFGREIVVPFPPESIASGIGDDSDHAALWYRRLLTVPSDIGTERLILHFGAVDHEADVWVDGQHAGHHEGGQTPFSFDATDLLDPQLAADAHQLVVRAVDDRCDVEQPRGKQDWLPQQHVIWYRRTSGIWRTVWLEQVPAPAVSAVTWSYDLPAGQVTAQVRLTGAAPQGSRVAVEVRHDAIVLGAAQTLIDGAATRVTIPLPRQTNGQGYEDLLWSPDHPVLLDATVSLLGPEGSVLDAVESYCGLRSVAVVGDELLLNDRPFLMRGVLEQGYWPESQLTPPSLAAMREEVELIKSLGFNSVRIHQKVEDPRFLFWCDALGLAVWSETAAAYTFSDEAVAQLTREWLDLVRRDISHPCIIAWVPFNESWGVQHLAHDPAQRAYTRALTELTRALDPTRPVISNDGWEHTDSDLLTVHDYADTGAVIEERYATNAALSEALRGTGPAGRQLWLGEEMPKIGTIPVLLTEFGGVSYDPDATDGSWGYSTARSADDLEHRLSDIMGAVHRSRALRGFCYTQLTDTGLETNGLCYANRDPKLPITQLRAIFANHQG